MTPDPQVSKPCWRVPGVSWSVGKGYTQTRTFNVSTLIFHTTNAPMLVGLPFTRTWSRTWTLLAQQARFRSRPWTLLPSGPSSRSLSWRVMKPGRSSTDTFHSSRGGGRVIQYGGEVIVGDSSEPSTFPFPFPFPFPSTSSAPRSSSGKRGTGSLGTGVDVT